MEYSPWCVQGSLLPDLVPVRENPRPVLEQRVSDEQRRREAALVKQHMPLLKAIFKAESWKFAHIDRDDLFSAGLIGLWKATRRWDETRGRFSTIARSFILGEFRHYARDKAFLVSAPGCLRERGCRIRRLLGAGKTREDVMSELNLNHDQLEDALLATAPVHFLWELSALSDDEDLSDV